jgi:hypothetical protein
MFFFSLSINIMTKNLTFDMNVTDSRLKFGPAYKM